MTAEQYFQIWVSDETNTTDWNPESVAIEFAEAYYQHKKESECAESD